MASTFHPRGGGAAAANTSRLPASILLDQQVHISDRMNDETIATVKSKDGHTIELSFWIHKPPALSYFVHKDADFAVWPQVVGAEGRFVLFRASFASNYGRDEYFMYKAADGESGESASLDPVPLLTDWRLPRLDEFGIVPRGGGGHYLLAALCLDMGPEHYRLHIYSSEAETWTTIRLKNPCPEVYKVITSKVVTVGEGVVGWVDLHHGMLVCDFRQETINADAPPNALHIPLPNSLPGNRDKLEALEPGPSTKGFRDLTCVDGLIKFIEMEHRVIIIPEKPSDPSEKDMLYDSDLIKSRNRKRKDVDEKPKQLRKRDGWRVVTWSRMISGNSWNKGCVVDVADISVDEPLLSRLNGGTVEKLVFQDMYSAFPVLSMDGDDILYLKSVANLSEPDGHIVVVDLGKKRVEALGAYSFGTHGPSVKAYRPSVSACSKIEQATGSTNVLNITPICVASPGSCKPDSQGKHPRLLAEKVIYAQNGIHSTVHKKKLRLPATQDLPPQSFIKDGKYYPPNYSLCPHQNNLPSPESFNKGDGPYSRPGSAPLAPACNLHGYGNYRPPWSKHSPLKQLLTPSIVFGPHKAPQPWFNEWKWNGARYQGYSQQLPAPRLFGYGTHLDYGNNQLQSQQLDRVYELQTPAPGPYAYGTHSDYDNYQLQRPRHHDFRELPVWQQPPPMQHHVIPSGF